MREQPAATAAASLLVGAIEGGGTKFNCAVGYSPTHVLESVTIPTTDAATTLAACIRFFRNVADKHGRVAALGVACFGPLQMRRDAADFGCLLSTPKAGWSRADVVSPLTRALEVPVVLDTDVGAAATAEWRLGAGRGLASLAYVTVGTGIGGAVVPEIQAAQRMTHAEMGHILVRRDARDGDFAGVCPFHGDCLEGLASGPAIRARWGCDLSSLPHGHFGRTIVAGYLGQLATSIVLLHAVDRIVMGGGVMSDGSLLPLVRDAMHQNLNGYVQPLIHPEIASGYLSLPALGSGSAIAGALLQAQDSLAASLT